MNELAEVANELEENYIKQQIFGSDLDENKTVVKEALKLAEQYLWEIDEEQTKVSQCLEQTTIEWEENLQKCKVETPNDCDEIENFLEEIKKMRGRK